MEISLVAKSDLTSLGKELRIDALESFLPDDSCGAFSLETAIYLFQLRFCESGRTTKARQRVRSVSRRLLLFVFRVCEAKAKRVRLIAKHTRFRCISLAYRESVGTTESFDKI